MEYLFVNPAFAMNDPKNSKNYAIAKGPVNRRTTQVKAAPPAQVAPSVRARILIAKSRHRLGTPLSQRLNGATHTATLGHRPTPTAIIQAIGGTIGATGLVLGLIEGSVLVIGAGVVLLSAFGLWAYLGRGPHTGGTAPAAIAVAQWLAPEDLERLDAVMEKLAAESQQTTVDLLAKLKESISRCAGMVAQVQSDGSFLGEDALYLRETVRRYIPDSIASYLQVPQKDRETLVIDGSKPALGLLHDQLSMVQQQLDKRETQLTQIAGESLVRQQRFLAEKSKNAH